MRLIDADELCEGRVSNDPVVIAAKCAPTVDTEPVRHGQWESDMYFDEPVTRCTACKRGFAVGHKAERFQFCPNCGAKMDGGILLHVKGLSNS